MVKSMIATIFRKFGIFSTIAALAFMSAQTAVADTLKVGDSAPSWELISTEGELVRYPDLIRKGPSLVLFWASWCPYCKALMPEIADLRSSLGGERLEVLAVNFAEKKSFVLPNDLKAMPFIHLLNGDAVAEKYDVQMLPAFFLVVDGKVVLIRDYPPESHPSQQTNSSKKKSKMLAQWWTSEIHDAITALEAAKFESASH